MAFSCEPKDGVLDFTLGPEQANASMKLKNSGSEVMLFKVKTTQPMWYFVRPNFDVIEPGQEINVTVSLVEDQKNKFVEENARGNTASVSKHRFMVQAATLSKQAGKEAVEMKNGNASGRDYTSMWNSEEKGDILTSEKQSIKFKVTYNYVEGANGLNESNASTQMPYVSPLPEYKSTRRSAPKPIPTTPQEVKKELVSLRSEYETLLQSYCRVQAEKELLEQQREMKKGELRDAKAAMSGSMGVLNSDRPGFSLLFFVISTLLAFMLGQYLSM